MGAENKVIFSDTRETAEITLPTMPGSKVTIFTELNVWQQREIQAKAKNDQEKGIYMVLAAVKEWNLYQDEATPLPITEEVLNKFKDPDIMALFAAVLKTTPEKLTEAFKAGSYPDVKKNTAA